MRCMEWWVWCDEAGIRERGAAGAELIPRLPCPRMVAARSGQEKGRAMGLRFGCCFEEGVGVLLALRCGRLRPTL